MAYLTYIEDADLIKHIHCTLCTYSETLKSIDLKKFNENIIDPIKLTFDSLVYNKSIESIVCDEIARQRDKTNTNSIGYFHQNIFRYIKNCEVPLHGFDVIYTDPKTLKKIYVEMKNKHNTMNSAASQKTYIKLSSILMKHPQDQSFLVEVIAKHSQNVTWSISVDGQKVEDQRVRRVSIDKFYEIVTGEKLAFFNLCKILPTLINKILVEIPSICVEKDTVLEELYKTNQNLLKALYLLAFKTYEGFDAF